jgi:uncharacterized protein (TIGR02145 family)
MARVLFLLVAGIALAFIGCSSDGGGGGSSSSVGGSGTFTDKRDGQTYKWVKIGEQTWMAENLNFKTADGNSRCYGNTANDNDNENCDTYGRLYNWTTAMASAESSDANPSGVRGVCPDGWHLPSDAEWDVLVGYVHTDNGLASYTSGTSSVAGSYLKAASGWGSNTGTDDYGFSALPGGWGWGNGSSFGYVGGSGVWWSSTERNSNDAWLRDVYANFSSMNRGNGDKFSLYSVRCLQD